MTHLNPVQEAVDRILDLDLPDEIFAEALAAQLEYLLGEQTAGDFIDPNSELH